MPRILEKSPLFITNKKLLLILAKGIFGLEIVTPVSNYLYKLSAFEDCKIIGRIFLVI